MIIGDDKKICTFLNPKYVFIPVKSKNIKEILVKDNSYVYKFDKIIEGDKDIYSSISGRVLGIKNMYYKNGVYPSLVIENDFTESVRKRVSAVKNIKNYNTEEAYDLLLKFGIDLNKIKTNNILVVNTIDLEQNIDINKYVIEDKIEKLYITISKIISMLKFKQAYVLVKSNEEDLLKKCTREARYYHNIRVKTIRKSYPVYSDKIIKKELDENNVTIVSMDLINKIYHILKRRTPIVEVYFSILGDSVSVKKTYYVKKYSLLSELFLKHADFTTKNVEVFINGLYTGEEVHSLNYVIDDDVRCVIINKKGTFSEKENSCEYCEKNCPLNLNVKYSDSLNSLTCPTYIKSTLEIEP